MACEVVKRAKDDPGNAAYFQSSVLRVKMHIDAITDSQKQSEDIKIVGRYICEWLRRWKPPLNTEAFITSRIEVINKSVLLVHCTDIKALASAILSAESREELSDYFKALQM